MLKIPPLLRDVLICFLITVLVAFVQVFMPQDQFSQQQRIDAAISGVVETINE